MSKRSKPALYELVSARVAPRAAPVDPDVDVDPPPATKLLGGGRSVRLPVGYLVFGGVTVVLLVLGAYMLGYERAKTHFTTLDDARLREQLARNDADRIRDPLLDQPASGIPVNAGSGGAVPAAPAAAGNSRGPAAPASSGDPRVAGRNYFVKNYPREGAPELASFLRSRGLDAWVVPGNNPRSVLVKVSVLPGFDRDDLKRNDPAIAALKKRISDAGLVWKVSARGRDDLRDFYLEKYDP